MKFGTWRDQPHEERAGAGSTRGTSWAAPYGAWHDRLHVERAGTGYHAVYGPFSASKIGKFAQGTACG